jgi:tetrapyrrole methylase family protein/MazG family protein
MSPSTEPPAAELHPFDSLVALMQTLRGEGGCAWDRAQTLDSLKSYAIEELYEVLAAIDSGSPGKHREELGDLLLQVVFQSQIRNEEGAFDIYDVCREIGNKMLRRHPHVFGEVVVDGAAEAHASWEKIKASERAARDEAGLGFDSVLAGVPRALPSLLRALRLAEKAATVGFDWQRSDQVLAKVREELEELEEAIAQGRSSDMKHELGDLLMSLANVARHLGIEPEDSLRAANDRFTRRFQHIESAIHDEGKKMSAMSLEQLEERWQQAKAALASGAGGD